MRYSTPHKETSLGDLFRVNFMLLRFSTDSREVSEDYGKCSRYSLTLLPNYPADWRGEGLIRPDCPSEGLDNWKRKIGVPIGKGNMWRERFIAWKLRYESSDRHGSSIYLRRNLLNKFSCGRQIINRFIRLH
jgi:hypothetical protein